jgi:hypothetical protein
VTDIRTRLLSRSMLLPAAIALLAAFLPTAPARAAGPAPKLRIQNELSLLCLSPAGGDHAA